jgi:ribosomal protein L28
MAKCSICGRGPQFGHHRSHSMRATNRRWNINVQKVTVYRNGRKQRIQVCTRCLRTLSRTA